ncbi:MAG: hypothetical protein JNM88_13990 [Chitinophagaceae bacterium]|nr:hypothetical protein [Chitinophagaceae bacterium]
MFTKADIEKYFIAEKQESLLFMFIGAAGIIAAIVFYFFIKTDLCKGAAIPSLLIGLLLGVVGYTVYKRSDDDRKRNVYAYDLNPAELKDKELPRMKKVMKNFVVYRYVEIGLLLAGLAICFLFYNKVASLAGGSIAFWKGLGASLAIMSALALTADYFAEKRGRVYTKGIESFISVNK